MPHQTIIIKTPQNETFSGYLSTASDSKAPGIVLIQEIFGVNQSIREKADGFAAQGYTVLAPDLFWRFKPNIDITDQGADLEEAYDYYHRFDRAQGVKDIAAAVETLRGHPNCNGKVAVMGFCFGGLMTYLTASQKIPDAAIAFYGGGIADHLDLASAITCPLLMFFGDEDEMIPPEQLDAIHAAFAQHPNVEIEVYKGVGHAFFNHRRGNYHAEAAEMARKKAVSFLRENL